MRTFRRFGKPAIRQTWKSAVPTWPFGPMGAVARCVPSGVFKGTTYAGNFLIRSPAHLTLKGRG